MKRLVILSGAGMSAESGLPTFRDMGGIWEKLDVTEVASPSGWEANPGLVLRFYNERRKKLFESFPNQGHFIVAELEKSFDVRVITQNIDDLHEQAGSTNVLHLHGELKKARSTVDPTLIHELEHWELKLGDLCARGSQLRPHVVWFGEEVESIGVAQKLVASADIFVIAGTSMNVYPAAGLLAHVREGVQVFVIDPVKPPIKESKNLHFIQDKASTGFKTLKSKLVAYLAT